MLPYESPRLRGQYIHAVRFCNGTKNVVAGSAVCHDAQVTMATVKFGYAVVYHTLFLGTNLFFSNKL